MNNELNYNLQSEELKKQFIKEELEIYTRDEVEQEIKTLQEYKNQFHNINIYNQIILYGGVKEWLQILIKESEAEIEELSNGKLVHEIEESFFYDDISKNEYIEKRKKEKKKVLNNLYKWLDDSSTQDFLFENFREKTKSIIENINSKTNSSISLKSMEQIFKLSELTYDDFVKLHNPDSYKSFINSSFKDIITIPQTSYPNNFICPKDKISNLILKDELGVEEQEIRMEKYGNKAITTKASININIENLPGATLNNPVGKIDWYDWQVHNAIVSLYIDGRNQYLTPLMIHRVVAANEKAKLTSTIESNILKSIEKLSMTRVSIDSEEEANFYKLDQIEYTGNILYTKTIKAKHKGNISDWIYIIESPVLYQYASAKKQITRTPLSFLNTPINKNKENTMIQAYLYKRVLDMKGSMLSKNILYETLYKQLDLKQKTPGAIRKKQTGIRDTVYKILDYWKDIDFIKDYKENIGPRNSKQSITIMFHEE